jgi:hypothetical protein
MHAARYVGFLERSLMGIYPSVIVPEQLHSHLKMDFKAILIEKKTCNGTRKIGNRARKVRRSWYWNKHSRRLEWVRHWCMMKVDLVEELLHVEFQGLQALEAREGVETVFIVANAALSNAEMSNALGSLWTNALAEGPNGKIYLKRVGSI